MTRNNLIINRYVNNLYMMMIIIWKGIFSSIRGTNVLENIFFVL